MKDEKENNILELEIEKYKKIWKFNKYKMGSPECKELQFIIKWLEPKPIKKILIFGCGEGHGIHKLTRRGYDVYGLDIVDVLVYPEYKNKLIITPIWQTSFNESEFDAIIGIDVLEHIPSKKIVDTLKEINKIGKFWYFGIATRKDQLGELINDNLHLIVKPPSWWLRLINQYLIIESYAGGMRNLIVKGIQSRKTEIPIEKPIIL